MAITLNVGGSKKVSANYDSQGVSLNVTAEVPNDAVNEPQRIVDAANDLFDLVNHLLDEQIAKLSQGGSKASNGLVTRSPSRYTQSKSYQPQTNGNAHSNGSNGNGRFHRNGYQANGSSTRADENGTSGDSRSTSGAGGRKLTQAQQRAIGNMLRRLGEDGDAWVHEEFGIDRVADLTVRQASQFIHQVDPARLAHGRWSHEEQRQVSEGDICAAYSADLIAMVGRVRKPFKHHGVLWTCVGLHSGTSERAEGYRLVPLEGFVGSATTYTAKTRDSEAARHDARGFYHGMIVTYSGQRYVLIGPPVTFVVGQAIQANLFGD